MLAVENSQNMIQPVEKKVVVEPLQSDYYRKSNNNSKLNTAQSIKSYNSMSPSRGIKNKNVMNKQNSNQKNSVGQNFDYNLGLKNKARILQKNADK